MLNNEIIVHEDKAIAYALNRVRSLYDCTFNEDDFKLDCQTILDFMNTIDGDEGSNIFSYAVAHGFILNLVPFVAHIYEAMYAYYWDLGLIDCYPQVKEDFLKDMRGNVEEMYVEYLEINPKHNRAIGKITTNDFVQTYVIPNESVLDYSWITENFDIQSIVFESTYDTSDDGVPTFANCKGLKRFAVLDNKSPFFTRDGVLYMHLEKNPTLNMFSRATDFSNISSGVALVAVPPFYPRKRFVMPDDVVMVAVSAFGGCNNIEEIVVSDSIQVISAYMFGGLGLSAPIRWNDVRRKPAIDTFMREYNDVEMISSDLKQYESYNRALTEADMDSAARECQRLMHEALAANRIEDAYFAAEKMMDCLYDTDILCSGEKYALLAGGDNRSLLINTILSIECGNLAEAVSLADQGLLLDGAMHYYYLKSIALMRMGCTEEAESINGQWLSSLRENNESVDSRCRYAIAHSSFALDKPFMGDMQSFIRHNQLYLPGYEMLRRMMREKGLTLATDDTHHSLVDVFNAEEGNLAAAWRDSDVDARRALVRAILDFPYE